MTFPQAISVLEQGATLVTASQRLSRSLSTRFDTHQMVGDRSVWPTADIVPWSAWLIRCWNRLSQAVAGNAVPALLLSAAQQQKTWESVIDSVHRGRDLVEPSATAGSAAGAWELLHAWMGPLSDIDWQSTADTRTFLEWQHRYRKLLAKQNWLDTALLPDRLLAEDPGLWIDLSHPILLAGFEEFTPQQRRFLDRLQAAGVKVLEIETAAEAAPATEFMIPCSDAGEEIVSAAEWAAGLLAGDRDASIAVVVPNLEAQRSRIERIFTEVLHPDTVEDAGAGRLFNISLGLPLSEYPIIFSALTALACTGTTVQLEDIGHVLRSPFFAGAEREASGRALADAALRKIGALELPLARIIDESAKLCPILCASLRQFRSKLHEARSAGSPSYRARMLSVLLDAAGWPGDRKRTSAEYQVLTRWKALLSTFAALEAVAPSMRLGESVQSLRRLAVDDVFQPRTDASGVQILGLLETSGLSFDHLWVMGLHDEVWPVPASPNAFLPSAAQRRCNVPHSTSERELHFARDTTARLRKSARHLVWSYPRHEDDRVLRPSSLLPECPILDGPARTHRRWAELVHAVRSPLAADADESAVAPAGAVRGGARLLQDMAACPFKAYARHRLGADGFAAVHPGLDASGRGSLLHDALRNVWAELHSSAALQAPDVPSIVRRAVAAAIDEAAHNSLALSGRFRELEQERLELLILDWLDVERQRGAFEIAALEQKRQVRIGPLEMNIRIDRIDQLPGGGQVMIDYKTGRKSPGAWDGERPDEPQIPLYASTHDSELTAVAFAQLAAGKLAYRGHALSPGVLPGVKSKDDWEPMIQTWREVLEALAARFTSGEAHADPKKRELTCRLCDLTALCRIEERIELAVEDC